MIECKICFKRQRLAQHLTARTSRLGMRLPTMRHRLRPERHCWRRWVEVWRLLGSDLSADADGRSLTGDDSAEYSCQLLTT
jgi:hypothetical protein